MNAVIFDLEPGQHVTVIAYGLNYPGRVTQCCLRANDRKIYEVEYAAAGKIDVREFSADELFAGIK
jgi:hypothetical protein